MSKIRLDVWLWSVRLYKTRTQASKACNTGKVRMADRALKASYLVQVGDEISIKKDKFKHQYRVLTLIQKRVGFPIAKACYTETTPESWKEENERWTLNSRKSGLERPAGTGRPTKRERRDWDSFQGD